MQTRLIAGRDFTDADRRDTQRVVVVNEAFVARFLDGKAGVGARFRIGSGPPIEIVGVVQDGKYEALNERPKPVAFHPLAQWNNSTITIVARTSTPQRGQRAGAGDERQALDAVRRIVHELDPQLAMFDDGALSQLLALPLLPMRLAASLLSVFGALAIVLASVGIYGLISYSIARRMREICIRIAIGASAGQIVKAVVARTAVTCGAATAIGSIVAFAAGPLLSPLLVGADARDPLIVLAAVAILGIVMAAAIWVPTRRALATDPAGLLRSV